MKTLNTQTLFRPVSRLSIFATLVATILVSGQAFAGKPEQTTQETLKAEVAVTYDTSYGRHVDPRTGDTCTYSVPNTLCLGFPVAFAITWKDTILAKPWSMDWDSTATISVLRGKAFDEVDAELFDQVYAPESPFYVSDVRFSDTLVVDVYGDGTERYKIGFISCSLDHDSEACSFSSNQVIHMSIAPL